MRPGPGHESRPGSPTTYDPTRPNSPTTYDPTRLDSPTTYDPTRSGPTRLRRGDTHVEEKPMVETTGLVHGSTEGRKGQPGQREPLRLRVPSTSSHICSTATPDHISYRSPNKTPRVPRITDPRILDPNPFGPEVKEGSMPLILVQQLERFGGHICLL